MEIKKTVDEVASDVKAEATSSTVFLISMKDVLASLYSLHPCLIAETQALAAKRMLSGSMITPQVAQKRLWLPFG
jgi:hypothetical protein